MPERASRRSNARQPYVLLSAAMSADGYIDASGHALELSATADWDRVDELCSLALSEVLLEPGFSVIGNDEV